MKDHNNGFNNMAKLVIVSMNKPDMHLKGFSCKIGKLCEMTPELSDVLYHTGNGYLPTDGDIVYKLNQLGQYELFSNNTASLNASSLNVFSLNESLTVKYIKTNFKGICTIINCN